jgi:hypothetical protein
MWSTYSELDSGNEGDLKIFPILSNELTSDYCPKHAHLVAFCIEDILSNFHVSPSTASAWLAQSVERETLRFHLLNKAIDPSQGCGFDPRIGLFSFFAFLVPFSIFLHLKGQPRDRNATQQNIYVTQQTGRISTTHHSRLARTCSMPSMPTLRKIEETVELLVR